MSAPLRVLIGLLGKERAQAAMIALEAAGYVCVPRTPTPKMMESGWAPSHNEDAEETWHEMVRAFLAEEETSQDSYTQLKTGPQK
jgi:hypothetical protein